MATTKKSKLELLLGKQFRGVSKAKSVSLQKRKIVSISVVAQKKNLKFEEESTRVHHDLHETPFEETRYRSTNFIDDQEVKITLSSWKDMRKRRKIIDREREIARLKIEQIKNTAGFNDNMDAMRDFHKLIGVPMNYPTFTRAQLMFW
ncbi:hypothetical protein P8452_31964 [Trifolium repens]|nr:hypothetical protein P8452_31964 [Trifolium repens]